jgi:ketosteroid isomerase-like protein
MSDPVVPAAIRRYQDAHDRRDTDAALAAFTPDARVRDDGHDYRGREEIRGWLSGASVTFDYSRTLVDVSMPGPDTWLVTNHLEGHFPGGEVDLRYQFRLRTDLIAELVIEP